MDFYEFQENVVQWATDRNIYIESTCEHQIAKALEEIGELITAITDEQRADAIGDISVCLVNAAYLAGDILEKPRFKTKFELEDIARYVIRKQFQNALLATYAQQCKYEFEECLQMAWNTIKDRKGKMINGKFVKED